MKRKGKEGFPIEDRKKVKRRRGERRRHPLENKPWKEKLHHQEIALDEA